MEKDYSKENKSGPEEKKLRQTGRTTLQRFARHASHEREIVNAILDECLLAHIAVVHDGGPAVVPFAIWRVDDFVYFHGSARNRVLGGLVAGGECCLSASIFDGLVLARVAMHHSISYRSVVLYGRPEVIAGLDEKRAAMRVFFDRFYPGRWDVVTTPSDADFDAMCVLRLAIDEASAKVAGDEPLFVPGSDPAIWSGTVPLFMSAGLPIADSHVPTGTAVPSHVNHVGRQLAAANARRPPPRKRQAAQPLPHPAPSQPITHRQP